ncbi:MAG: DUF512 domain-containing protein [Clostridia bacterium]|nr:DUF512 domain-containing protein [Clostridia bacterium]
MSFKIAKVTPGSPAARSRILPGESLVSVNGKKIRDVLDYRFYTAERHLHIDIEGLDGRMRTVRVVNRRGGDIGLEFETYLMDKPRSCHNKCIFCFIDQLPRGMRDTLYFKDDDTRLSFLTGNYVTLTNISDDDITRIINQRISPINISVHTTDPELRKKMLNNKNAGKVMGYMQRIADAGLPMNGQIVLCPGVNDGEALKRTMQELSALYPSLRSVSCVPVGLTRYREGLFPLQGYDEKSAAETVDIIDAFGDECKKKFGTRLFFAADEFYIKAKREIPPAEHYEEFLQIENGVGMIASFRDEFYGALLAEADAELKSGTYTVICGADVYSFLSGLVDELEKRCHNLNIRVQKIDNEFFGTTITVSGLICGCDILSQLRGVELGEAVLFTKNMLRSGTNVFLDDMTTLELEEKLGVPFVPMENDGGSFFDFFVKGNRTWQNR